MLKVHGISSFYGQMQALWNVDLEVNEGEIVALIGSNGAGKSTTLRSISRIVQPLDGTIEFESKSLTSISTDRMIDLGIAHVPEGRRLFAKMTVQENLIMGARRVRKVERKRRLGSVLELFPRLNERRNQLAGTLSGGEQQMVAIGRALMTGPRFLMLDEPSLGLAPKLVDVIFDKVAEINKQGVTVLLVEQNARRALMLADRGYVLANGRVVDHGSARRLLADPGVQEAYLGVK